MCTACSQLAELETLALEAEVIDLEVDAGWSSPVAVRPLHPWEVRAKVRFGDLDRLAEQAAGLIAHHAAAVHQAAIEALLADLAEHATSTASLLDRLNNLTSPTSSVRLPIDATIRATSRSIELALADVRHSAAAEVLAEARRQGVVAALLPDSKSLAIGEFERQALAAGARAVAEAPLLRVLDVAGKEARSRLTPNGDPQAVVDAIGTSVRAISPAGVRDQARQAAQRSIGAGREAAAQETPEPEEVYASELLDGSTCIPCSHVDGRLYENLDAALVDYPGGGGYADCAGGARCRGTLVFVWATEQAPSLDNGPGDTGHPIDREPKGPTVQPPAAEPAALPIAVGDGLVPEVASGLLTTEQYDAMRPESTWSETKRQEILDTLGTTPEGKILADTLARFQDGGSIARLRGVIEKRLAGEAVPTTSAARADALLDAIRNAPEEWAPDTLYRGMTVKGTLDNVLAKYAAGDTLDLSLTSFTTDAKIARKFQQMTSSGGRETRIMVELIGDGKKVLPIQNLPKDRRLFKEKEWVSAGRYRIVEVKKSPSGGIIIRVVQEGTP